MGAPDVEFDIAAHRSAVFFKQSRGLLGAIFLEQCIGVNEVGVADQKRVREILAEIRERRDPFGIMCSVYVGIAQVVSNVVAEFAGSGFSAIERIDRFAVIVVEGVGIANDEPSQGSGVFFGVTASVGFDSGVG